MLRPLYIYGAYWGTWNRVLHFPGCKAHGYDPALPEYEGNGWIEVNLTPVNGWPHYGDQHVKGWTDNQLDQVRHVRVRAFGGLMDRSDLVTLCRKLPQEVLEGMWTFLGGELTDRLLTEDFLPQIDWVLYRMRCNGGCDLRDCSNELTNTVNAGVTPCFT